MSETKTCGKHGCNKLAVIDGYAGALHCWSCAEHASELEGVIGGPVIVPDEASEQPMTDAKLAKIRASLKVSEERAAYLSEWIQHYGPTVSSTVTDLLSDRTTLLSHLAAAQEQLDAVARVVYGWPADYLGEYKRSDLAKVVNSILLGGTELLKKAEQRLAESQAQQAAQAAELREIDAIMGIERDDDGSFVIHVVGGNPAFYQGGTRAECLGQMNAADADLAAELERVKGDLADAERQKAHCEEVGRGLLERNKQLAAEREQWTMMLLAGGAKGDGMPRLISSLVMQFSKAEQERDIARAALAKWESEPLKSPEANPIDTIASRRGWLPLEDGEEMTVHFNLTPYVVRRGSRTQGDLERELRTAETALAAERERVAALTRERDEAKQYKQLYNHALDCVDQVFQQCTEIPNPLLPDFCRIGEDKFRAVVRLAKAYIELTQHAAALTELRDTARKELAASQSRAERAEGELAGWQNVAAYYADALRQTGNAIAEVREGTEGTPDDENFAAALWNADEKLKHIEQHQMGTDIGTWTEFGVWRGKDGWLTESPFGDLGSPKMQLVPTPTQAATEGE